MMQLNYTHNNNSNEEFMSIMDQNQQQILNGLKIFISISQQLENMSSIIHAKNEQNNHYSIDIYKHFRQLTENIQLISLIFQNYASNNQSFLEEKDFLIQEQIRKLEEIHQHHEKVELKQLDKADLKYEEKIGLREQEKRPFERNDGEQENEILIEELNNEILHLQSLLQNNDQEFEQEIKKYNQKLFQLQDTLEQYENQLLAARQHIFRIQELENKVVRMREEKYRDQIIIENMAKKIRIFEKERGGQEAFLSHQNHSSNRSRLMHSPEMNIYHQGYTNPGRTNLNPIRSNQYH